RRLPPLPVFDRRSAFVHGSGIQRRPARLSHPWHSEPSPSSHHPPTVLDSRIPTPLCLSLRSTSADRSAHNRRTKLIEGAIHLTVESRIGRKLEADAQADTRVLRLAPCAKAAQAILHYARTELIVRCERLHRARKIAIGERDDTQLLAQRGIER